MIRPLLCTALLACSFGAAAADWQQEFFSNLTNELPPVRGAVVDNQGNVHLQAFNRFPDGGDHFFAHQYTIAANGGIPWMWGLTRVARMSDCGVQAKTGQRLDCVVDAGPQGEAHRLQMRSPYDGRVVWEAWLPEAFEPLGTSIPEENDALVFGRMRTWNGDEALDLLRYGPAGLLDVQRIGVVCPSPDQTATLLRQRMPAKPSETLRILKACTNPQGVTDLFVHEHDHEGRFGAVIAHLQLPAEARIAHAATTASGKAYVLVEHDSGLRELLASGVYGDAWMPMPLPGDPPVAAFVANDRALIVALEGAAPDRTDVEGAIWFDPQGGFWPQFVPTPGLSGYDAEAFAVSDDGALLAVGKDPLQPLPSEQLWTTTRHGQHHTVAALPLAPNETTVGAPYLLAGPDNVAVIARTIARADAFGGTETGVRVNQYDLPMAP